MEYKHSKYCFCISLQGYDKIDYILEDFYSDLYSKIRHKNQYLRNLKVLIIHLLFGPIAVSRDKNWITGRKSKWHTHHYFLKAQNTLEQLELITIKKGYKSKKKEYNTGFSSILFPTNKFNTLFKDIERRPFILDIEEIPLIAINTKEEKGDYREREYIKINKEYRIIRKNIERKRKKDMYALADNRKLRFKKSSLNNINYINNELFSKIEIGFSNKKIEIENHWVAKNVYLSRVYTGLGTGGGRFTQLFSGSYQQIKKDTRRKYLLINKQFTKEVDFSSLHPNLLYCKSNVQNLSKDIYTDIVIELIGKPNDQIRDIVKIAVLILINAKSFRSYISAMNKKHHKELRILKQYNLKAKDILGAIKNKHPIIAQYLHSDLSYELMGIESDIMEEILLEMSKKQILGVPLHDSIICQVGFENQIQKIMKRKYKEKTGFDIIVEIK